MSTKKHNDLKLLNWAAIIALVLCVGFAFGFAHGRGDWKWDNHLLNTEVVGQYGDFIGGVVGTFLSVILLYYTFYQQRKDSSKNSKVYEKQQLNDDFYHLLALYQKILNSLSYTLTDDDDTILTGKEALHAYLDNLRDGFPEGKAILMRKTATFAYMDFYALNRDFAPIYYRTFYRICETLINKEDDTEYKNVEYNKILRAQLSDSEMVLMRYNALTRMGKPMQLYINRFNLLKHLPSLDLLEYKKNRKYLNNANLISMLNVVLVQIRQRMEDILDYGETTYVTLNEFKSSVSVALKVSKKRDVLKLIITKREAEKIQRFDILNCIKAFEDDELKELFSYFLYDCVVLHNFQMYNIRKNLDFQNNSSVENGRNKYIFYVRNTAHQPINMTWYQYVSRGLQKA